MGFTVKKNTVVAVVIEDTEGTYKAPTLATEFVQTLADGFELGKTKEVIERDITIGSVGKASPRTGIFEASATIPVELRAHSTEGTEPEYGELVESALGAKDQITSNVTSGTGHSSTVLNIADIDITKFNVGNVIFVKEAGAFHVSPIIAVDETPAAANITLLVPHPDGAMTDGVVISKSTTYKVADTGHPSLSISKYIESAILEQAVGCKVSTLSIENFATGQIPSMSFGLEGLNFDSSLTAPPVTPAFDSAIPPIMLDGGVYQDGAKIQINELSVSLENTLGLITSICEPNGRISSRVTDRTVSGTFNPYKPDDSISNFTAFKNNTPFSLFAYGKLSTSTPGEFDQVVAVYMPNCIMTEFAEADQDGILQDSISFSADRGIAGDVQEIYIAFM